MKSCLVLANFCMLYEKHSHANTTEQTQVIGSIKIFSVTAEHAY